MRDDGDSRETERAAVKMPSATELAPTERAPSGSESGSGSGSGSSGSDRASGSTVGRFRLDAPLGSGGMGEVYRAYDPVLDRAIALKVLHADTSVIVGAQDKKASDAQRDAQRMRRVLHEARAAAALTHPNTVTIFEVGEAGDDVFIAMELLEGEDLRSVMEREREQKELKEPLAKKRRWLLESARALDAAHKRGLVHRDVKPENMFICKGSGTLKLLDFGIAKREDESVVSSGDDDDGGASGATKSDSFRTGPSSLRTQEGYRLGTPRYMAPEQRFGHATDGRTDQYGWGLVAYELLTGNHPDDAPTAIVKPEDAESTAGGAGALSVAVRHPLALASSRRSELETLVGAELATVIARTLEPLKDERFESMAVVVAALEEKEEKEAKEGARDDPSPDPRSETNPIPTVASVATTSPKRTETKRKKPPTRGYAIFVVALGVLLAAGFVGVAIYQRMQPPSDTRDARIVTKQVVPFAQGHDRLISLPDGEIIVIRDVASKLRLNRLNADGGVETFLESPFLDAVAGTFEGIFVFGGKYDEAPAVYTAITRSNGLVLGAWTTNKGFGTQRINGAISGTASAQFGGDLVTVTTSNDLPWEEDAATLAVGVNLFVMRPRFGQIRHRVEPIQAVFPAISVHDDRFAIAYTVSDAVSRASHFLLYDSAFSHIGDTLTIDTGGMSTVVAFAGSAPVVFWIRDVGKPRLFSAILRLGEAAFSTPEVAIDEPVSQSPVVGKLPDGRSVVFWVRATGGLTTLRAAVVLASGKLSAPASLGSGPRIEFEDIQTTTEGLSLIWGTTPTERRITIVNWAANIK